MGSVSSLNPGVANLLETLSNVNSPVLSSPAAVSALETAPAADIVQLSRSAAELETVDALFGIANPAPDSGASVLSTLLANLDASGTTPSSAAASSVASAQPGLQADQVSTLFGNGSTGSPSSSALVNLIG